MPDNLERLRTALASRYALERELGSRGMATVYLAQDLRHERKVAVKVLRPALAASLGSDRFFREIHVAAQLQHPHILPLLDSGEADGFLYYVMPYVDGESLRDRLRRGELPVEEAVRILTEVADALGYAHRHGVVHRDIKPDNVLLSSRHALVMDFGVAKAVSEAGAGQKLTETGMSVGTPAYMAPEQALADPNLDHRVDIYALGVMGYEMLAGRRFSAAAIRSGSELLLCHPRPHHHAERDDHGLDRCDPGGQLGLIEPSRNVDQYSRSGVSVPGDRGTGARWSHRPAAAAIARLA